MKIQEMQIKEIASLIEAKVLTGEDHVHKKIDFAFASDLMSDVLTLKKDALALITGLSNLQTIRTAEMSDIHCVILVRGKKGSKEMIALAKENDMVLMECPFTMFRASGILYSAGISPVY